MILQKVKSSEKIVRMIESENVLVFESDIKVRKEDIKKEVEDLFGVKVQRINNHIRKNKKLSYVKLKKDYKAIDIANKLGVI